MKKIVFLFFIITALLSSCKKEVNPASTIDPAVAQDRDALNSLMNEWYFWYMNLPSVTLSDYKDPYELMDALRYKPLDRWSFVADYNAFIASMQGTFVGHGIRIGLDAQGKARIVMIYKNSPLYTNGSGGKGVRRGWIIKTLNGSDLAPALVSLATGNSTPYNNLIGPATAGRSNTFVFSPPGRPDTTAVTVKSTFQVNSVLLYDTLTINSKKTGHLVFNEFITPSSQELADAFVFFKAQNVKDLILDLRYNSGGILDVAAELASYISGASNSNTFIKFSYNDKKSAANDTIYKFKSIASPLNLTRLVVITTRETASASEEVINGLKPYLAITTIGDTTDGKPTGMNVWQTNDNKYVFAPVTFEAVNSLGQGGYYNGFAPAKLVSDDFTRDFTDKGELCYKEAIYFLANGTVSSKGAYIYRRSYSSSEKPVWMNNLFIFDKPSNLR
jgi:C-terminal processing protease CtpA/Prc